MRYLYALVVPGGLILLAAALFLRWAAPETVAALLRFFPYAVLAAGVLLGWRFHRTSVIFVLVALALVDRALAAFILGPSATVTALLAGIELLWCAVGLLLPLNLIAFSIAGDRGSLAGRFGFGFGVLAAQVLTVVVLALWAAPGAASLLNTKFLPEWLPSSEWIAHPVLVSFTLAAVFLAVRCVLYRKPLDNGFLWALASSFLALTGFRTHGGSPTTFYFSAAGLILVVAVIEAGYAMAFRDELTLLAGRRALNEALQQTGGQYAVAMVDVDHFKKFNDTYGHDVGDQVLKMVARRLEEVTGGGRAFRYGGEEFSVLFPGKTADEALPHLDLLRATIEDTRFALRGPGRPRKKPGKPRAGSGAEKNVAVTVSIGVAAPSERAASPDAVIKAADKALYRAKKGGRNQVRT